jgi:hypothetical protein
VLEQDPGSCSQLDVLSDDHAAARLQFSGTTSIVRGCSCPAASPVHRR